MASVADVLFGNKKPIVEKSKSIFHQDNKYDNCGTNRNRHLSQDKINQLLGIKSIKEKRQIKTDNNFKNISQNKNKLEIKIPTKNSNSNNLNKPSLIIKEDLKTFPDREKKPQISKLPSKEEKLYNSLKEFKNINEVFEEIENNKEYEKMFKEKAKKSQDSEKELEKLSKSKEYKPGSAQEEKMFKAIDEINKIKELEDSKLLGKKQKLSNGNSSNYSRSVNLGNLNYSEKDVWCSKCKKMHSSDFHKLPTSVDMKKVFGGGKLEKIVKQESVYNTYHNKSVDSNYKKSVSLVPPNENTSERIKSKITSTEINKRIIEKEQRIIKSPATSKSNDTFTGRLLNKLNFQPQSQDKPQFVSQTPSNNFYKSPVSVHKIYTQSSQTNDSTPLSLNSKPPLRTISIEDKISKLKNKSSESSLKEKDYKESKENRDNKDPRKNKEEREHGEQGLSSEFIEHRVNHKSTYHPEINHQYKQSSQVRERISSYTKSKSHFKDAAFSREDFEDRDFIVEDEDEPPEDVKRHLNKIKSRFMRRNHKRCEYDDYSDGDLEVANFDQIQDEEEKTARIGAHEDLVEEMMEKEMLERKRRKYI